MFVWSQSALGVFASSLSTKSHSLFNPSSLASHQLFFSKPPMISTPWHPVSHLGLLSRCYHTLFPGTTLDNPCSGTTLPLLPPWTHLLQCENNLFICAEILSKILFVAYAQQSLALIFWVKLMAPSFPI